jgi:hypothetical protein
MAVRCPQCEAVIDKVTPETMVYCRDCRKWCRIAESSARVIVLPEVRKIAASASPKRGNRCH